MTLHQIVEGTDTPAGKTFDWMIISLIILSIVTFSVETLPTLDSNIRNILQILEVIITIVFTIEYGLRIYLSWGKKNYAFTFYGVIDLLAILPFYLALGVDLRALRIFRLLRLVRLLKLTRYHKATKRFSAAIQQVKEELILFLCITGAILYLAAVGIYYFEHDAQPNTFTSIFDSLWWAVATLTTVGYGDVYPITIGGKLFTFAILMAGLGIVAIPAGLIASALSD